MRKNSKAGFSPSDAGRSSASIKRYKKLIFIDDVFPERSENLIPRDADIRSLEEQILLEEEKEKVARWLSRLSAADKQF